MKRLSEDAKAALSRAVRSVEAESSVEAVIAVRPDSMSPLQAYALAPPAFALLGLFFLVESPWPFSNLALWLDTALFSLLGYASCRVFPSFGRLFIVAQSARRAVCQAAHQEMIERGVTETRERTGMLIYVSQREGMVKVSFDRGIRERMPAAELARVATSIEGAARGRFDGLALAQAVEATGPVFAARLPRRHDDINELDDGVYEP